MFFNKIDGNIKIIISLIVWPIFFSKTNGIWSVIISIIALLDIFIVTPEIMKNHKIKEYLKGNQKYRGYKIQRYGILKTKRLLINNEGEKKILTWDLFVDKPIKTNKN